MIGASLYLPYNLPQYQFFHSMHAPFTLPSLSLNLIHLLYRAWESNRKSRPLLRRGGIKQKVETPLPLNYLEGGSYYTHYWKGLLSDPSYTHRRKGIAIAIASSLSVCKSNFVYFNLEGAHQISNLDLDHYFPLAGQCHIRL